MIYKKNDSIQASSATYRKAQSIIEDSLGIEISNTKYPSEDFKKVVESIDDKLVEAYKKGLKRGFYQIFYWLSEGTISVTEDGYLVNGELNLEIKRLKRDGTTETLKYKLNPTDIGLEPK
jgi:hypothetical protein